MKKQENNHLIKTISIILLSIIAVLIIIAIFVKIDEYKRSFYKIGVRYKTNDVVKLNNKLPISDAIGKSYSGTGIETGIAEYKEFTVSNPNEKKIKYEVYLTKFTTNVKDIRSNYIKLYLTDDKDNPLEGFNKKKVVSYYDLYSLSNKPGSRLLYSGSLKSGESKTFILRSWVADTYVLSSDEEGFSFNINARIK